MIKNIINRLFYPNTYSNKAYINFLRSKGVTVGIGTNFVSPKNTIVDVNYGEYITIGDNCCLSYVTILAHDFSWYVMVDAYNEFIPEQPEHVHIGNNCFLGYQSCILKGSYIEDNVIIGARSLVKGRIPSNTVWAGNPAKYICNLEEYRDRKRKSYYDSLMKNIEYFKTKNKRYPTERELKWNMFCFLQRNEENYNKYIKQLDFNGSTNSSVLKDYFFSSEPEILDGYEGLMKILGVQDGD